MKRIILALSVLAITGTVATAQQVKQAPASATATKGLTKIEFTSAINELDAALQRNRPELAQQTFMKLAEMMQLHIVENNKLSAKATTDSDKAKMSKLVTDQTNIYSEAKMMSADIMKNKTAIIAKLNEFVKTI